MLYCTLGAKTWVGRSEIFFFKLFFLLFFLPLWVDIFFSKKHFKKRRSFFKKPTIDRSVAKGNTASFYFRPYSQSFCRFIISTGNQSRAHQLPPRSMSWAKPAPARQISKQKGRRRNRSRQEARQGIKIGRCCQGRGNHERGCQSSLTDVR